MLRTPRDTRIHSISHHLRPPGRQMCARDVDSIQRIRQHHRRGRRISNMTVTVPCGESQRFSLLKLRKFHPDRLYIENGHSHVSQRRLLQCALQCATHHPTMSHCASRSHLEITVGIAACCASNATPLYTGCPESRGRSSSHNPAHTQASGMAVCPLVVRPCGV